MNFLDFLYVAIACLPCVVCGSLFAWWHCHWCSSHRRWSIKPGQVWRPKRPSDPFEDYPKYHYRLIDKRGRHVLVELLDAKRQSFGSKPESMTVSWFLFRNEPCK